MDLKELLEKASATRWPQWRRYALSLTRNQADADDVVQDAIAKTLLAEPDLDSEERVHHYVQRAIRNTAFSLIDGRRRYVELPDPERALPGGASALEVMLDSEDELAKRRLARALKSKLPELRDDDRQVIEGLVMRTPRLKLREMAEIQGVATPTVHYRLKTALKRLLELVEEVQ